MSDLSSVNLENETPGDPTLGLIAGLSLIIAYGLVRDMPEEYARRTTLGRTLYLIQAPFLIAVAAVGAIMGLGLGVIWAVTAIPWLLDKGMDAVLARLGTTYKDLIYREGAEKK